MIMRDSYRSRDFNSPPARIVRILIIDSSDLERWISDVPRRASQLVTYNSCIFIPWLCKYYLDFSRFLRHRGFIVQDEGITSRKSR